MKTIPAEHASSFDRVILSREALRRKIREYANRMADDLLDDLLHVEDHRPPERSAPVVDEVCMGWNRGALAAAMAELQAGWPRWHELITYVWAKPEEFENGYTKEGNGGCFFVPRAVVDGFLDTADRDSWRGLTRGPGAVRRHQIKLDAVPVPDRDCWLIARSRYDKGVVALGVEIIDVRRIWAQPQAVQ